MTILSLHRLVIFTMAFSIIRLEHMIICTIRCRCSGCLYKKGVVLFYEVPYIVTR